MSPSTPPPSWRTLPLAVRDAAGAALLLVLSIVPLGIPGVALGELHHDAAVWLPPLLIVGQSGGLVLRRIRPAFGLAIVGASFAAAQLAGVETGIAGLGLFVAIYSFATYQPTRRVAGAVASVAAYAALAEALHLEGSPERLVDWVTFLLVLLTPWLVGQLVRRRLAEQQGREAIAAERAVRDARAQLARDLHVIVTHHVTAIVVQAESSAYLDEADVLERVRTLDSIAGSGRHALQELRALLGALESTAEVSAPTGSGDSDQRPLLGDVASLVEQTAATGYPVALTQQGNVGELSEAVAVTLYRVAQEALTNAMKHAPREPVALRLDWSRDWVELLVTNPLGRSRPDAPGRGRRGMAHRVALLGGTFDAGPVDDEFRVRVGLSRRAEP